VLPDGTITSDADLMAAALSSHWGAAFEGTNTVGADMSIFLFGNTRIIDSSLIVRPEIKDVHLALRKSQSSAPGPDGIRGNVWARFALCFADTFSKPLRCWLTVWLGQKRSTTH
jgi:hypothetical protein